MQLEKADYQKLWRNLLLARKTDEALVKEQKAGNIHTLIHPGLGQEGIGVGTCTFLRPTDYLVPSHRGWHHIIAKGMAIHPIIAEHLGRATGCGGGQGGWHLADMSVGVAGVSGTMGGQFPMALGLGLAAQRDGDGTVAVCIFGEGASNRGQFHESLNMAAVFKAPIVWVCEYNEGAAFAPTSFLLAADSMLAYGPPYDMPTFAADGNDILATLEATQQAVEIARSGGGPSLVQLETYRLGAVAAGMMESESRPAEELARARARDPVRRFRQQLLDQAWLSAEEIDTIDDETSTEVAEAVRQALEDPYPSADEGLEVYYRPAAR